MSQITDLLKRLRAEPISLSQTEISRKTGIPQPRVSRWESGDVPAGADDAIKLIALAKEMGIEVEPPTDQECAQLAKASS